MFHAEVYRDQVQFAPGLVRLMVWEDAGGHRRRYLMSDGNWLEVDEGAAIAYAEVDWAKPLPGIALPAGAVEPLAQAIAEFEGRASHGATEAAVLRESLTVERGRVDRMLDTWLGVNR